jgi:deoxyribonuclease V
MISYSHHHHWNVDVAQAVQIQTELARAVEKEDRLAGDVRYVAGVDVAYEKDDGDRIFGAVVVIDLATSETVATSTCQGTVKFPYVPGLFAFRELPHLLKAFEQLERTPDLVICDGQGIAHPRRCGLASHLGVLLDVPTVGCGKTRFIGEFEEPGVERGSASPLCDDREVIGSVLRTQHGVKPLFVSIGHRVTLETSERWILQLADRYRQPEPIRRANELVNKLRSNAETLDVSEGEH